MTSSRSMIAATVLFAISPFALAEQPHFKPHRSQPATTAHASPETTGTMPTTVTKPPPGKAGPSIAARLASLPDPSAPDVDPLPTPFELPVASRARMRLCGERWHHMKLDGEAHDEIWRDFATSCLVEKAEGEENNTSRPKATNGTVGLATNKQR